MKEISKKMSREIVKSLFLPTAIILLFIVAYIFYKIRIFPLIPVSLHQTLQKYIAAVFVIAVGSIAHRVVNAVLSCYRENIAEKTVTRLDDKLVPLARRTAKVAIWVIALLIILPFYGVNISALVTALGVSSLAIALAAQDTISNIIAGFMIMVDMPFRIGDKIKLSSGEIVTVYDIGMRRSKFIFEDASIIIVPNLELSKSKIINYTYGQERLNKVEENS